jgi:aspartate racemase
MKKLGLIGGISWVSTLDYYKYINEGINAQLGGLNFSECIIYSFNYAEIKKLGDLGDWDGVFERLLSAANHLKNSGAEGLVLCANTMHYLADKLQIEVGLPVIHIAEATAQEIKKQGISKVGLLGTKPTMTMNFYTDKLAHFEISTLIPNEDDREFVHYTIFEELGRNLIKEETKARYLAIINELQSKGAEGIILGCTEIPMLIKPQDVAIPIFDTVMIHARAAVAFSLA